MASRTDAPSDIAECSPMHDHPTDRIVGALLRRWTALPPPRREPIVRSHDTDIEQVGRTHDSTTRSEEHADLASKALSDGRPSALDRPSVVHLQASAGNASVSRLLADEEGPTKVKSVIGSGGGERMDDRTAQHMEERFGEDFSGVRIHRDARAADSARAVNAHAYTVGNEIVFQSGRYDPDSETGRRTLAHELTHVVQQRAGPVDGTPVGGGIRVSHPSDTFEQAASHNAERLMSSASPEPIAPARVAPVQRDAIDQGATAPMISAQRQAAPEEEEEQAAGLMAQRQAAPEEEEEQAAGGIAQREAAPEEEEEQAAGMMAQRQAAPEEEEEEAAKPA